MQNHNNKKNDPKKKGRGNNWKGMLSLLAWALVLTLVFSYFGAYREQELESASEAFVPAFDGTGV